VAVARALLRSPRLLLADEPTGNLDEQTGDQLFGLLRRVNEERGITVILVTHSPRIAAGCDRVLRLESGRLGPPGSSGGEPLAV
jgi:lipoprotein-releasing system ATP-binding protein